VAIISGGIDLSIPAVMTLMGAVLVKQSAGHNQDLLTTVALALAVATGIGAVNGVLIAYVRLNALIVTLAMAGTVTGGTLLWAGVSFSSSGSVPSDAMRLAQSHVGWVSTLAFIAIVMLIVFAWGLRRTRLGRYFVAAGTNPSAAKTLGIPVPRYEAAGYVVAGFAYGLAGLLLAAVLKSPDYSLGGPYQLETIVAVALGGASLAGGPASVAGTGAACAFLALLDQYLSIKGLAAGVRQLVNGGVLLAAVALVTVGRPGSVNQRVRSLIEPARRLVSPKHPEKPAPRARRPGCRTEETMSRSLDDYKDKYENARFERHNGVLEITLHTEGGPLAWSDSAHTYLPHAFYDVAHDPENRAVILTTEGDVWCDTVDPNSFVFDASVPPVAIDRIYTEAKALLFNLLDIRVPLITAFPGPAPVHADLGLVGDIVLASETAYFQCQHFGNWNIVPGDGNHVIYPMLLGTNRGRYHLLLSKPFTAQEAHEWGIVAEVLAPDHVKPRAREIAAELAAKPILGLRYTREAIGLDLKRQLQAYTSLGLALEGFSSGYGNWAGSSLHEPGADA
jgi:ribose/xylose/arabinose/galactoside ABC-type transport system permease subunit/enoyl-CoA hydratase/carnithine racemase